MREKDLASFAKAKYDGENIYANLDAQVLDYKERLEQATQQTMDKKKQNTFFLSLH